MPQSYPPPAYYLPGLPEHCTSIKHFDSESKHSFLLHGVGGGWGTLMLMSVGTTTTATL